VATPVDLLAFLREVRLFTAFAEADLVALAQRLRERTLKKNQVLFREGDPGDEMFLIRRGTVLVSKIVKARVEQLLNRQGPGEFFGEMSLLDGSPRSATIQAETEARRKVRLRYLDLKEQTSERLVRPLGCFYWGEVWTLAAWCESRADFRNFRVDRILDLGVLDERFRDEAGKTLADLFRSVDAELPR